MNNLVPLVLLVNQVVGAPGDRTVWFEYQPKIQTPDTSEQLDRAMAAARRQEFERRYQALVEAMNSFADKYNDAKGNIWPLQEAQAVRKAFRDLEKLETSFSSARR
jgi:hypothetical protein